MTRPLPLVLAGLVATLAAGCDCAGPEMTGCRTADDCSPAETCLDGRCVARTDGGRVDATIPPMMDAAVDVDGGPTCAVACGTICCDAGEICIEDELCAPPGPSCADGEACINDSYCHESGRCVPFGVPEDQDRDPSCSRLVAAGVFAPTLQCQFTEAPAGDPFPLNVHVLSTPVVVDFRIGRAPDAPPRPSIIAVFDDGEDGGSERAEGVIRILDGATCEQQAELGSLQIVSHSSPPAVGDLTGNGRPEIIAYKATPGAVGGLVAFTYDEGDGEWRVLWTSTASDGVTPYEPSGGGWAGPSLVDLDDDGRPEVLRGGLVFDADGRLLDDSLGQLIYSQGIFAVVADVDEDDRMELVAGHGVWEWDPTLSRWVAEDYYPGGTAAGQVALADFGHYPGGVGWPAETPEVVVITSGMARVQTLDGQVIFGPVAIPEGGTGGPPTVADFDGDGRPEFSTAGAEALVVFDLDCTAAPVGACASARTDGVLWWQPAQDQSSNVTGSSVFDFEGDGRAEVVYGDECFLRVYDGETGAVLFSQARSSCTWYENPVIADVDGDFRAEIVIGDNFNCPSPGFTTGRDCAGFGVTAANDWVDPIFAGLRCEENGDCLSGVCSDGFCRCTSDAECCRGDDCLQVPFVCAAPPEGTPGSGNTCRASRPEGTLGIRVYRDAADRWVRSRQVWNQHAYFVTNVDEDGVIPRTSAMRENWLDPTLNNFRQNDQGSPVPDAAPDLTSRGSPVECLPDGSANVVANICNRGTETVGANVSVAFYAGDPGDGGDLICRVRTETVLEPGRCEAVSCVWSSPAEEAGTDVWVVADDEGERSECNEANNVGFFPDAFCTILG